MINNFISIGYIFAKLGRDLNLNEELNESDIIDYVAEALAYIGAFGQYETKVSHLEVDNHKAKLPCDFYKIVLATYKNQPLSWQGAGLNTAYFCDDCKLPATCCSDHSFYIKNNYIITSVENDDICLEYLAIPVDEDGIPMIPDDQYYIQAVTSYVTYRLFYRDWIKGRIPDKVFQKSESDWIFYCNSARGSANSPSLGQLERYKNILQRPFSDGEFSRNFRGLNNSFRKYLQ